jgi:ATP phosphoribosyltransferase regulatory subunit
MTLTDRWLLPEGVNELLPPAAARAEELRRRILDLFWGWGYELVMPPLIEYLESLLSGFGADLDLQTFKITDQLTGRLMGVRADMTPQVARIDAHRLNLEAPARLCYVGPLLHTLPGDFEGSRNPLQIGAELYGHAGIESDIEILTLMIETLRLAGIDRMHVGVSHIGIFRGLTTGLGLDVAQESTLFELLQRKAITELGDTLHAWRVAGTAARMLLALVELHGDAGVLAEARRVLADGGDTVTRGIVQLEQLVSARVSATDGVDFYIDLAEMRGYHYHTGLMFEVYTEGRGGAVAWGGRYDDVGRAFGRARPATGFSTDLKRLTDLTGAPQPRPRGIFAPADGSVALGVEVERLRSAGERVVAELPGQSGDARAMGCDRVLIERAGHWVVEELPGG